MIRWRVTLILGAVAAALLVGRASADEERWYGVLLMGERAGWMHEAELTTGTGNIISESEMFLRIGRGDGGIEVSIHTTTEETAEGRLIRMRSVQRLGAQPVETRYEWVKDGVRVVSVQDGREQVDVRPAPLGEWEAPVAARRRAEGLLREGAKEIVLRTLDPTGGLQVVEIRRKWLGDEVVEALGKAAPASKWEIEQSVVPGVVSVEYLDADGHLVRGETVFGGLTLTMVAADKPTALLPASGPEFMNGTLIEVARPIKTPRRIRTAEYLLRVAGGELPDLPSGGSQRFERIDGSSGRLTVDLGGAPIVEEVAGEKHLKRSSMLDSEDERIVSLSKEALDGAEGLTDAERAERIRRFVHGHITAKNLDVGFATASEAARTRQGDCTEHGVLLAAMLRAAGIPSRCVSGLVYADGFLGRERVFGYHMWAQAYVRGSDGTGRWVDVDATLPDPTPFDATHIALAWTAFEGEDRLNAFAALAPLLGRLSIEVIRAE